MSHYTIVLTGNPNSGKTSLFNALTGSRYKVANYPGVTVERKIGTMSVKSIEHPVTVIDLPGIYSLSSASLDEKIASMTLLDEEHKPRPDLLVCVVDASNLERNLYLTLQLIDTGLPVVIALNMIDIAESKGIKIYEELLSRQLKVPVVPIVAKKQAGLEELKTVISKTLILSDKNKTYEDETFRWCQSQKFLDSILVLGKQANPNASENIQKLLGCGVISESLKNDRISLKDLETIKDDLKSDNVDPLSFEATSRYKFCAQAVSHSTKITPTNLSKHLKNFDNILTHPIWGTAIFVVIMASIFQAIFSWSQYPMDLIDGFVGLSSDLVASYLPDGILKSLVIDGIFTGVGSVIIFIPQIAILFLFLGLLEDSGYLSRAAFLMDGILRKVGLQGRAFIPLLSSFACAIPGIMATRTIPSWTDRLTTILIAPLMSCSARLPIYTVLIAAMVPNKQVLGFFSLPGLTLLSLYLLGILGAAAVSWILKKTIFNREPAFFIMEMAPLRRPSFRLALRDVLDRVLLFCKTAGTVILACTVILWFLSTHPRDTHKNPPELKNSYAGTLGSFIEPAIKPLGLNWEMGIGIIASFAAREVFISTMATIYNLDDANEDEEYKSIIDTLKLKHLRGEITLAATFSLLVFYVFACQCISTLAVARRETGSWKWVIFMFTYMTGLAYILSFITFRIVTIYT